MVRFDGYYNIAADEIAMVSVSYKDGRDFPYILTVRLKDGYEVSVSYKNEKQRDNERMRIVAEIDRDRVSSLERVYNRLFLVEDTLKRMDKRQLRIWRILSRLLHLKENDHECIE